MSKYPDKALAAAKLRTVTEPGMYADGNCLYLVVEPSGSKHWIIRTTIKGKRSDVGAGGFQYVFLAQAREKAIEVRKAARAGGDPVAEKREQKAAAEFESKVPTFETAARGVWAELCKSFRNEKHEANWIDSLETFVFPAIGQRRVDEIASSDILKILTPMWLRIPERARRTKQRMQIVFEWAKAAGFRSRDNPVDAIEKVLPKYNREQKHYAALPYADVPGFIQALRSDGGISGPVRLRVLDSNRLAHQ